MSSPPGGGPGATMAQQSTMQKSSSSQSSTRFQRTSLQFPAIANDKRKVNQFLVQAVQAGDLDQINALVLEDGADLECKDRLGRPLSKVAVQSELLLPHQKDAVVKLLEELPGRVAAIGEIAQTDSFSGLKLNTNATKHKHCKRNRTVLSTFADAINRGTSSVATVRKSAPDMAQHATMKNPDLMKIPAEQFNKTLSIWTKAVGGEPVVNALSRSGNLLYSDTTLIQDNAAAWGQLLGSREVALYYLSRSPNLLKLNQQTRSKCWQALLDVLKAKPLVFWVMHQSCVPQRVEVLGRSTYGSAYQGTYTRIDGCKINDKVVYVKDELEPPKPKIGSGPGPEFESPRSRRERKEKEAEEAKKGKDVGESSSSSSKEPSADDVPEITIPRSVMYLLLDEEQRWQLTSKKDPISKIPLQRVNPVVIRHLGTVDSRAILDPTQLYLDNFPWELRQGLGKFAEDRKLKVLPLNEGKEFVAKPLFYLPPALIRASYGVLKEMLGPLWAVNTDTKIQYEVCPDLRKKDLCFGEADPEATEIYFFKRLGGFSALKNYIYLKPDMYREEGLEPTETACEMVLWDPVTIYLLFYRMNNLEADEAAEQAGEDELVSQVPWLPEWTEEIGMMTPRVEGWKGGRFRVFSKSFPRGTCRIPGCGPAIRPPLIYGKVGAYGYSKQSEKPLFVNYTQKLNDYCFAIQDETYDPEEIAKKDLELEENPEEKPNLDDEEEQKLAMAEYWERQTEHLHPAEYQLLMLGSFDAFNDYTFLQLIYEDVMDKSAKTDVPQFTLQVSKPVTVFLCYFEEDIPDDVRVWHVTEGWKTDEKLKPPIIRHRKSRSDLTACSIRVKDFYDGEIKVKSSQGALMVAFFKPIPARSAEEDDVDPAKKELLTRPQLFSSHPQVFELFNRLRDEFGDVAARRYLARQQVAPGYQLAGQWIFRLGKVYPWVRELKLELLESFNILNMDEILRAVELHPEILAANGPHLTRAFNTMKNLNVFGGKAELRSALQKCPLLLQVSANVIEAANTLIKSTFEEESPVLFESKPDLLQKGLEINTLFDKIYAMFGGNKEFVNHRLKQSVKEVNDWQQWYKMLTASSEKQEEWIGRLQVYEDFKAVGSQTGKIGW
ncbi:unnamed protein product [Amoebophrya sp. A120]|nr:unnamed protein product [Amoebophrya sp. A120]|eukprot:GSA120T00016130001.1